MIECVWLIIFWFLFLFIHNHFFSPGSVYTWSVNNLSWSSIDQRQTLRHTAHIAPMNAAPKAHTLFRRAAYSMACWAVNKQSGGRMFSWVFFIIYLPHVYLQQLDTHSCLPVHWLVGFTYFFFFLSVIVQSHLLPILGYWGSNDWNGVRIELISVRIRRVDGIGWDLYLLWKIFNWMWFEERLTLILLVFIFHQIWILRTKLLYWVTIKMPIDSESLVSGMVWFPLLWSNYVLVQPANKEVWPKKEKSAYNGLTSSE